MKSVLAALLLTITTVGTALAQTQLVVSDLSVPTKVSPAYFGPNAFPVPDMMDGRTSSQWRIEMYADSHISTSFAASEDYTASLFLRLTIPLFTPRVNLVVWGPVMEYYYAGKQVCDYRRVTGGGPVSGFIGGDIYVSTDFMVFMQERHGVDVSIRAALKSASGGYFKHARYYDCPGYFFDAAFGRSFALSSRTTLKLALSGGFLCWQTDNGRQNDAVMYGLKAALSSGRFSLSAEYGGYAGWENDGDRPMTLKANASWSLGKIISLNAGYQAGLVDWPFHQFRFGVTARFK